MQKITGRSEKNRTEATNMLQHEHERKRLYNKKAENEIEKQGRKGTA